MGDLGADAAESIEIRSYRTVFDLERRIYRVDRLRLNPGGVPVRGVLYFVLLALAGAVAAHLGPAAWPVRALPWYVRDLALPAGTAALLTVIRIEGRPFHLAARALLRHAAGARHLAGLRAAGSRRRWRPPDILLLPDGSDSRVRRLRFTGPGAVLMSSAHDRILWRSGPLDRVLIRAQVTLRELPDGAAPPGAQLIELARGARLDVQPARRSLPARAPR